MNYGQLRQPNRPCIKSGDDIQGVSFHPAQLSKNFEISLTQTFPKPSELSNINIHCFQVDSSLSMVGSYQFLMTKRNQLWRRSWGEKGNYLKSLIKRGKKSSFLYRMPFQIVIIDSVMKTEAVGLAAEIDNALTN